MNKSMQQFLVLLWKYYLQRRQRYVATALEMLLPFIGPLIVIIVVAKDKATSAPFEQIPQTFNFIQRLNSLSSSTLLYSPKNNFTTRLTTEMGSLLLHYANQLDPVPNFEAFDSEEDLLASYFIKRHNASEDDRLVGLIFSESNNMDKLEYKVRTLTDANQPTNLMYYFKRYSRPYVTSYDDLFFPVQVLVNEAYLNMLSQTKSIQRTPTIDILALEWPSPSFIDKEQSKVEPFFARLLMLTYLITFVMTVKRIVEEKGNNGKELLLIHGVNDWVYWAASFTACLLPFIVNTLLVTLLFKISFGNSAVFSNSNPLLLIFILLLYGASFISMAALISIPFTNPVIGVTSAVIIWMLSYFPAFYLDPSISSDINMKSTELNRLLSCLLPNMGLTFAMHAVSQKELYGAGATFGNLYEQVPALGNLTLGMVLLMKFVSCLLCLLFVPYLDSVWPLKRGIARPLYFPFTPSYWKSTPDYDKNSNSSEEIHSFEGITLTNVRKEFGLWYNRRVVVDKLYLNIPKNSITVLMGSNGSGKSTILKMMTGMLSSTAGCIRYQGFNLLTQTKIVRRKIGFCPQNNVLYSELTVEQHLTLFGAIKGIAFSDLSAEVNRWLNTINLSSSSAKKPSQLSDGCKRRLALGLAFIGESEVLLLDEPTTGLDPKESQSVLDLLQRMKRYQTILLATNSLEEASAIGDKVAFLKAGQCCGSWDRGSKTETVSAEYQLKLMKGNNFRGDLLMRLVENHFPKGSLSREGPTALIFSLGPDGSQRAPAFFRDLTRVKKPLGVAAVELKTNGEEVALRCSSMINIKDYTTEDFDRTLHSSRHQLTYDTDVKRTQPVTGFQLWAHRIKGALIKRFQCWYRSWPFSLFQLFFPTIVVILSFALSDFIIRGRQVSELHLNLKEMYGNTRGFFLEGEEGSALGKYYSAVAAEEGVAVTTLLEGEESISNMTSDVQYIEFITKYMVGLKFTTTAKGRLYSCWFINEAIHSFPSSVNIMYQSLQREMVANDNQSHGMSISVSNHPFPADNFLNQLGRNDHLQALWTLLLPLTFTFFGAFLALFPIYESRTGSRLIQSMAGLSSVLNSLANLLFDISLHSISCVFVVFAFLAMDWFNIFRQHPETMFAVFLLILLTGFALIPVSYFLARFSRKESDGYTLLVLFTLFCGLLPSAVIFLVETKASSKGLNYLIPVFLLWFSPTFWMSSGLSQIMKVNSLASGCGNIPEWYLTKYCPQKASLNGCCRSTNTTVEFYAKHAEFNRSFEWREDGVLLDVVMLLFDFLIFWLFILLAELDLMGVIKSILKKKLKKRGINTISHHLSPIGCRNSIEDSDVVTERHRVYDLVYHKSMDQEALVVDEVKRKAENIFGVSFAVRRQECFALLGDNGSGKTSLIRLITGAICPDLGNIFVGETNAKDTMKYQKQIAYCSSAPWLNHRLTGKELLYFFGRMAGVIEPDLEPFVDKLLTRFGFKPNVAENTVQTYSWSEKKKLSLALALVKFPSLVIADNITCGIDEEAKRIIWENINYFREQFKCSFIMASSSLEESETFCSRLSVLAKGRFKCIGSSQQLKSRYGNETSLLVDIDRERLSSLDNRYLESVKGHLDQLLAGAAVFVETERSTSTQLSYSLISKVSFPLPRLFHIMEEAKTRFKLNGYSITETSLQRIYANFSQNSTMT